MDSPTLIVSFGGGVNSSAMLVGMHERGEKPDAILFADTGGEKPETYSHIEKMGSWLDQHEMPPIITVTSPKTLEADCLDRETLPSKAFGFGSCSEHFKLRPQRRWIRENKIKDAMWLVGIHAGEQKRAMRVLNQRPDIRFPLIEWDWSQAECLSALTNAGIEVPVKSACFFCPAMKKREIIELRDKHPDLLERAIEMEQIAKEGGRLQTVKGLGRSYSWETIIKADEAQLKLFDDEPQPMCDTCVDW